MRQMTNDANNKWHKQQMKHIANETKTNETNIKLINWQMKQIANDTNNKWHK